jgi:hypothetical protein
MTGIFILLGIMGIIFFLYNLFTIKAWSISASAYNWKKWKRIFFVGMTWGIAGSLIGILTIITRLGLWQWEMSIMFASAIMIMLIGVFLDYRAEKAQLFFHNFNSFVGIPLANIGLGITFGGYYWIPLIIFALYTLWAKVEKIKDETTKVEKAAFWTFWAGLLAASIFVLSPSV